MRSLLLAIALTAGCGQPTESHTNLLEVNPLPDLPSYEGGRVLHPWYFTRPSAERFPQKSVGVAADTQCFLADSYYRSCLIYECAADYTCTSGRCVDAALAFDPEGSTIGEDASGARYWESSSGWRYYPLHLAVCVR